MSDDPRRDVYQKYIDLAAKAHCERPEMTTDESGAAFPERLQLGASGCLFLSRDHGEWRVFSQYSEHPHDMVILSDADMDALFAAVREWRQRLTYTETSPDFPTPGHIIPETSIHDEPHTLSENCQCSPKRNVDGYLVHYRQTKHTNSR